MAIQRNVSGTEFEFIVSGHIDGEIANQMEVEILGAIKESASVVYINLAEATFLCSAAIRVLMQYFRQLKKDGKKLWVSRPSPSADEALEMTGFRDLIVEKS